MKNDLKEYNDIIIILNERAKPNSKYNKLTKIWVNTEDMELKRLIGDALKGYRSYVPPRACRIGGGYPQNYKEWLEYIQPIKKALEDYVEEVLGIGKPQWQILAERNGWGPR